MRKETIYLIMTVIGGMALLGSTIFVLIMWPQIPDQIPIHYNFLGAPDNYGDKGNLVGMMLLAWGIFGVLSLFIHFPHTWNIPVKVTEENRARVYSITRGMLEVIKFLVVLLMLVLMISSAIANGLPQFIMIAIIVAILLSTIIGMFLLFKNR